jgi:thioredoxin reductase (NADPH)
MKPNLHDVIIVGGGIAGLSAAIYLGRARPQALVIDSGKSLALWEPHVENYLGFPDGISGTSLLNESRRQARVCQIRLSKDEILDAWLEGRIFRTPKTELNRLGAIIPRHLASHNLIG